MPIGHVAVGGAVDKIELKESYFSELVKNIQTAEQQARTLWDCAGENP